jgi:hypothetical protein
MISFAVFVTSESTCLRRPTTSVSTLEASDRTIGSIASFISTRVWVRALISRWEAAVSPRFARQAEIVGARAAVDIPAIWPASHQELIAPPGSLTKVAHATLVAAPARVTTPAAPSHQVSLAKMSPQCRRHHPVPAPDDVTRMTLARSAERLGPPPTRDDGAGSVAVCSGGCRPPINSKRCLNRPGKCGGSRPWKRGWSHAEGTGAWKADVASV